MPALERDPADPLDRGALGLAAAYRSGEITPRRAVETALARVEADDDRLGAFVTMTAERALLAAAAAGARWRRGAPLSPLDGVVTAFKDLSQQQGVITRFGSAAIDPVPAPVSDESVRRLEAAGLVSIGKTNTPEFGAPCYTETKIAQPARTPFDLSRSAGGSSGGAAAAVSGGYVPIALASDGGGSIRIPASVCGLVGVKPSRGRISKSPIYGDITGLSMAGSVALSVRDSAAYLDAMAGPTPTDSTWAAPPPDGASYLDWCERDPGHLRVARFSRPVIAGGEIDAEVLTAYEDASRLLASLGHEVEDVDVSIDDATVGAFEVVWAVSSSMAPIPPGKDHLLMPLTRWLRARGGSYSAPQFGAALVAMAQASAAVLRTLAPYDAVLTPTLAQLPALVGGLRNDEDPAADFEAQKAFTPFTSLWNITGMPAVSLPTGWSSSGLPIGTMLAAKPGMDHLLYALSAQVESASAPWRRADRGSPATVRPPTKT